MMYSGVIESTFEASCETRHIGLSRTASKGLFRPKTRVFFCCGNSAADISKAHTFKWGPLTDEVLNTA